MDNVLKFRPRVAQTKKVPGELYETAPAEIDEIFDMVRGNLRKMLLVAVDDEGEAIVASYPTSLDLDSILELYNIVNDLVFDHEQPN